MFRKITAAPSTKAKGNDSRRDIDSPGSKVSKREGRAAREKATDSPRNSFENSPKREFKRAIPKTQSQEGDIGGSFSEKEGGLWSQRSGNMSPAEANPKVRAPRTTSQTIFGGSTNAKSPSGSSPHSSEAPTLMVAQRNSATSSTSEDDSAFDSIGLEENIPHGAGSKPSSRSNSLPSQNSAVDPLSPSDAANASPRTDSESPPPTYTKDLMFAEDDELASLKKIRENVEEVSEDWEGKKQGEGLSSTASIATNAAAEEDMGSKRAVFGRSPGLTNQMPADATAAALQTKVGVLEVENAELAARVVEHEAMQKKIANKLEAAESKESNADKLRAKLLAEIDALRKENLEMQLKLEASNRGEDEAVTALRLQLMQLVKDKASMEEQHKAEIAALQRQIDEATEEKERVEEELAVIQREKEALDEQLASVSLRAASAANGSLRVANERRTLTREMEDLKRELAAAKAEIGALIDEKTVLENENWSQYAMRKWSGGVCGTSYEQL